MLRQIAGSFLLVLLVLAPCSLHPAWAQPVFANGFETPCDPGDADSDRLSGCQEKVLKTDPTKADTDGDGLNDGDEVLGTTAGLDLPGLGARPRRKDILIEYDWFVDSAEAGQNEFCPLDESHSHRPTPAALDIVTVMFGAAPVSNPDGSTGINVIHDYGQGGLFTGGTMIADTSGIHGDGHLESTVNGDDYDMYYNQSFAANRKGYFHYVLMPHRFRYLGGFYDRSGMAEIVGTLRDEIIVSLFCYRHDIAVGHLIAHELGHNLTLAHGGDGSCNNKPNYNSVMNYAYTWSGVDNNCDAIGDGVADFSTGTHLPLDENALNENTGVCGNVAIDWDWNGLIANPLKHDLNPSESSNPGACGGIFSVLSDYNDWANIKIRMSQNQNDGGPIPPTEISDCPPPPVDWIFQ